MTAISNGNDSMTQKQLKGPGLLGKRKDVTKGSHLFKPNVMPRKARGATVIGYGAEEAIEATAGARHVQKIEGKSVAAGKPHRWLNIAALDPLQVHDMVRVGVKTSELEKFISEFNQIPKQELLIVLGVSERSMQRHKDGKLDSDVSGAAVDLAAITEQAVQVLGSMDEAERWLSQPAVAFNGRRPIDLLATRQGADLVRDHLVRMEYGVYA